MDLLWPGFLLLLGLIPLVVAIYVWLLRRRRRYAVRYSSLALIREALPHQSRLRRHLPFALFLLALASLVIALGRPVTSVTVPIGRATIILAMDVSRSMCATDILPNRLEAAKGAAQSFIQDQSVGTQIGIVAFAGFAAAFAGAALEGACFFPLAAFAFAPFGFAAAFRAAAFFCGFTAGFVLLAAIRTSFHNYQMPARTA